LIFQTTLKLTIELTTVYWEVIRHD